MRRSISPFPALHIFPAMALALTAAIWVATAGHAYANVFSAVHGVVHDPRHRPLPGVQVTLQAADSAFALRTTTNNDGEFELPQAPIGVYLLKVAAPGFATVEQPLTVASGTNPVLHIALQLAPAVESVEVEGLGISLSATDSATPTTLITRADYRLRPGRLHDARHAAHARRPPDQLAH